MSKDEQFDLVVIGAGTAANAVARACSNAGWKVASVDALPYGGTSRRVYSALSLVKFSSPSQRSRAKPDES